MKIAIISSGFLPVIDGITVTLSNRLQKLSEWGHQVLLFCPNYSCLKEIYPNYKIYTGNILPGVKVVNLSSTSFLDLEFERNVDRQSYQTVLQELDKFQPDIIHVDEPERLFWGFLRVPGVDFAKRYNLPCVSFFHTNFLEYGEDYFPLPSPIKMFVQSGFKLFLRWLYSFYDLTIVSGEVTYQKLVDWQIKRLHKADLLGVNLTKFSPLLREENFFESQYNIANIESKIKLVFLGRLTPDKGWKFTLNAFSKITQEINPEKIALIIVGEGSLRDEIAQKLAGFTAHTYCLGRVDPEDIPSLLANADLHVTTSAKETKGLTILEAFASGIPAIAPRAGGVIDSIQDGWNGLLFTPKNERDFIAKLKILIDNPTLRKTMGANARKYVSQYNWERGVQNLLNIWQQQIMAKKFNT